MLVISGLVLFVLAFVVVAALGHAASDEANSWRLDEKKKDSAPLLRAV